MIGRWWEFLGRNTLQKKGSGVEGKGGKGSNVFGENPPDRQKLTAEGGKPDFRAPFLASRYVNSFFFLNSFQRAAVSFSSKKL